ncbi:quinone-dependent dihydroorotate dehydrogenase [Flavobacteriaceae bacterium]|nr:quinone-dependent dihydroorotate dehydrogenase [Flavobacteriales bacterium]MBL6877584.1 quinone-dependent dihydroorotate dehydrogenase [Flavobacteriaceae bacterium]MDA8626363.1 quinone-dependent dihydroorotate dehydrogenase [Flavobacteriaceae bacterium]MDA9849133.1 quinone-dependent dihydroorotate dehydrogenase [Flavobacteriaceae bacterium]
MYKKIILPVLFLIDPEKVHNIIFSSIKILFKFPFVKFLVSKFYIIDDSRLEKSLFGIKFKNPVGLAAGFDKNAQLYEELTSFGFGFIEIGTVTPKPQSGNPKKRLFRLVEDSAIINRMGFNNIGVEEVIENLKKNKSTLIGGNIGKNKITPNYLAIDDYVTSFNMLFDFVDYFVVNVSSPNTPNLRDLQEKEPLTKLINSLISINRNKKKPKPILLKIAPDLNNNQLLDIISIVKDTGLDGVIATNTTINRNNLKSVNKNELGGLSGKPLTSRSTEVIKFISKNSNKTIPIIGVGGINTVADALEKFDAGADLIQIYTGFIYEGPNLIRSINKALLNRV